jgi:hypothetical protein
MCGFHNTVGLNKGYSLRFEVPNGGAYNALTDVTVWQMFADVSEESSATMLGIEVYVWRARDILRSASPPTCEVLLSSPVTALLNTL